MSELGNCQICSKELKAPGPDTPYADWPSKHNSAMCDWCFKRGSVEGGTKYNEIIAEERKKEEQADINAEKVLVSTTDKIFGRNISGHLGIARGGTARAKNAISDIGAGIKNIVGGELKAYTKLLADAREEAIYRMKVDAARMGADAVVGVNFSTSMIDVGAAEISAFGTAVTLAEEDDSD